MNEIIRKRGSKWVLYSHKGKILGRHDTKADAESQERAVQASKHGESMKLADQVLSEASGVTKYVINTDAFYQTVKGYWLPDFEDGKNRDKLWSEDLDQAHLYDSEAEAQAEIDQAVRDGKIRASQYEVIPVDV